MEKNAVSGIENDVDLSKYNTFGIHARAKHLIRLDSESQLPGVLRFISAYPGKVLFLGGGSNILFTEDFDGLVIKIETTGIEVMEEDDDYIFVRAQAGEQWDELVKYCVKNGYGGIENLSLIPGTVGSSPVQNIGAYGVELKDVFYMLEAISIKTGEIREFYYNECQFDYRYSVFKGVYKGVYLILSVILKLNKKHNLNISYGAIQDEMKNLNLPLSIDSVSQAVISIRRSKLPDPELIGNAGSFFRNPVISSDEFNSLIIKHPDLRYFNVDEGYKIAAGWLIEKCGWKGYREGDAGVHQNQALVIVNYGNATGLQIKNLADKIALSVFEKYGINLEPEVNIL